MRMEFLRCTFASASIDAPQWDSFVKNWVERMEDEYSREEERNQDKIGEWINIFYKSSQSKRLSEEQKHEAGAIISMFAHYMFGYFDSRVGEWDTDDVEECCLEVMPIKVTAEMQFFSSIEPVLSAFFNFIEEKKFIANGQILANKINGLGSKIVEVSSNPRNWGPAKSLVMSAKAAGVDITNSKDLNAYINFYNMQQLSGKDMNCNAGTKEWNKTGRNDPCPCNSGKKFKKCCLGRQ